eukprot:Gregarina_sp_Poly_1__9817@NODE_629_length_7064_cov_625_434043_g482_i0_p5_GENE_NODE_629_length_7064_cov_625_434043_g482_i0NODE_629_length_7064_cov_625_434043_g482_i0_p5_ORF_typecomplete_len131_score20_20Acetyltransf_3/PF13302_7/6_1e20Acetyltransf_4/PF13420_7/4_3e08FR47/PF08445_10/3_4e07Acetyltransf_8/PF13523_6/9_4e07Acetyltransf_1/PF00583_25/5e06Acetyltransf_10/PF13673_7/1_9e05Acetyltransf_7/PF13508_7/0_017Gly_acyl_tr_C/PF08444_10/0_12_NODE_629_length_7064_cov_625_434043_g482_i064626854
MTAQDISHMQQRWNEDLDKFNFLIDSRTSQKTIGDIGLFFAPDYEKGSGFVYSVGEISMMIAEPNARHLGFGSEAFLLMATWAKATFGTQRILAKIKNENIPSRRFFMKLGFKEVSRSHYFQEISMELEL